jgi:DNA-binding SARP family transcriptional activator
MPPPISSGWQRFSPARAAPRDAVKPLQQGIRLAPYDVTLYRQLAGVYLALGRTSDEAAILRQANEIFPQDAAIRKLLENPSAPMPKP